MKMAAVIDPTATYRYSLWREWDSNAPTVGFMMLNPSTADDRTNDATIRRCIGFAQAWGYGSLAVVNLFAYRATHAQALLTTPDPVGPENDYHLLKISHQVSILVAAWGNQGTLQNRDQAVLRILADSVPLYCLGKTQSNHPRHPLYMRRDTLPMVYTTQLLSI
ncbi:MAG: DUF1643 domain-containing protein [Cyanothece sp. SIO1E1]|nr:DUF1643 domain-containing protein [Cyanothece sp. SIO1E1]